MPRFNHVRPKCCVECNGQPRHPARAVFDGQTWAFEPALQSDQMFTVESAGEGGVHLVGSVFAPREALPLLSCSTYLEGYFQRDVC